jgi:hypothetical protein
MNREALLTAVLALLYVKLNMYQTMCCVDSRDQLHVHTFFSLFFLFFFLLSTMMIGLQINAISVVATSKSVGNFVPNYG